MKTLTILALMGTLATASLAADTIGFTDNDTPATVLQRQSGRQVELRLVSGETIKGKVKAVGTKSVHITALTGSEFYDAVVLLEDISAVVLRNDGK